MEFIIEQSDNYFKVLKKGNSRELYKGKWSIIFQKYRAKLFDKKGVLLYSIKRERDLFKLRLCYIIKDENENIFILQNKNKRHSIFEINIKNDKYEVKIHKGRKKSVFKNGVQIALINEKLIEILFKDKIGIIINSIDNIKIVFLLILCLKIGEETSDSIISFDFGQLLKMEPIDENWKPKKLKTNIVPEIIKQI